MLSALIAQISRLVCEVRYLRSFLSIADSFVFLLACIMLLGVFLPWVSVSGLLTQTGLMGGGDIHMFLALVAMYQVKTVAHRHIEGSKNLAHFRNLECRLRKISMSYLVIGVLSMMSSIFVLIYCGSQYTASFGTIDVRFGFYLTAFAGLFISFCGLERFKREKKQRIGAHFRLF